MKQIEWDIIERKLEGVLSSDEEIRFREWVEASEKNEVYFHKLETFYKENGFVKEITGQDVDMSWGKFTEQLKEEKRRKRRTLRYWAISGVAACLLVGVLISTWMGRDNSVSSEETKTIVAGGSKAVLWLSNGEKVELENNVDELKEASVRIVNSGSVLSYEKNQDTVLKGRVMNKVETPRGGEYGITLADGTRVYLGALSKIEYPVAFDGAKRVVKASGEVYFDVARDTAHPFVVEMTNLDVEVLGTSFNVRDYADEDYVEATLVSGKIKVNAGKESCILEPNYQAVLDKKNNTLETKEVDVSEFVDWKSGKLNVRNRRLEDILNRLSKWYDVYVFYVNEEAKDIRFYANIDRYSNMNELLDKFEKTGQVEFRVKGNVINVMMK
ncbi:FecR family protein [Butyricimonas paravirosa]|uniref:FecR family protein n=1 Tax=Butyricimonas paravirosa TaxID=1472417 RepID=UPI002A8378AB|nr:FecR domain-containing protein [Butyricimonas paravirosa]